MTPEQASNRDALRALFPQAFVDGRLDLAILHALLGEERFGLCWPGKADAAAAADAPCAGALQAVPDGAGSRNRVIVGDNLPVLKLLQPELGGQVGLIYIDPPYNTGNAFVYSDRFRDGAGRQHAPWLSMMHSRLLLARRLLRGDGVLVVSIDDNEVSHLRLLLDEIFGEANHVATIAASLNPKGRQLSPFFATSHEHLLFYARDIKRCALEAATAAAVRAKDFPLRDAGGAYRLLPLRNTNTKFHPGNRPNLAYPLYVERDTGAVSVAEAPGREAVWPKFGSGKDAVWRWGRPKAAAQAGELFGRRVRGRLGTRWDVFQKDYNRPGRKKKLKTVWTASEVGSTDDAVRELKALGVPAFDTPKPTALLQRIVSLVPADACVVDFFAGSGTTGEAVMRQNLADGGSRRFVLVQQPVPVDRDPEQRTIADLTCARLRAAAEAIRAAQPAKAAAADLGFVRLALIPR